MLMNAQSMAQMIKLLKIIEKLSDKIMVMKKLIYYSLYIT